MRKLIVTILFGFSLIAWFDRSIFAEPAQPAEKTAKAKIAAKGEKVKPEDVLRQMANYLGNLPAVSCSIEFESTLEVKAKGIDNHTTMKMVARLQRPNRFALVSEGEMGVTVVSDGKQLVQYISPVKRYTVSDAPADLADLSKSDEPNALSMMGAPLPTNGNSFYKALMSAVTKSEYLGTGKVGNIECHHCRFSQEQFDWEIWIGSGDKPLILKLVPDFAKRLASAGGALKDAKMTYTVLFTNWNTAPKFTDADFAFTPPADAEKVDSLMEALPGHAAEGPHPLLGQPAPPFATVDLDEHPVDLKTYLGKNVIMLDFWATTCGPCVEAMPKVDAVAKKFADKGLVFRAVNVGEDAKTIKEFLESNKLEPPVALDTKNEIAPAYKVSFIPQTVLIGKDGKVQVVHVGFGENLEEMLSKEIEDLLAGKDLAGPELKKAEEARKKKADRSKAAKQQTPQNSKAAAEKTDSP